MKDLKEISELAYKILNTNTPYLSGKIFIQKSFINNGTLTKEDIEFQLSIIDTFYSTQMNKRYYGIEEITESILNISDQKVELEKGFINYLDNPEQEKSIGKLFTDKFGYNKKGKKKGVATSLMSKYAYFLTNYQFPIYDTIVREVYPLLNNNIKLPEDNFNEYVRKIKELLEKSQIQNFDKLDNLLWLIGKIRRGNYSLLLSKEKYLVLTEKIGFGNEKSIDVDEKIKTYVKNNLDQLTDDIFEKDLIRIIKFSQDL